MEIVSNVDGAAGADSTDSADSADGRDPYGSTGEFLDLASRDGWRALRPSIVHALDQAVPARGPIVDIGAGTGIGTMLAVATVSAGDIIAVEPSPTLRAVLLARLADSDTARARVTVQATDIEGMRLPASLGGVLAINMIGHLTPARRRRFWADLRTRLAPQAPLIVNIAPPTEPIAIPEAVFGSVTIGRQTYRVSGGARPTGPDCVVWTMRYETADERGAIERAAVTNHRWYVLGREQLLDELASVGFVASEDDLGVVVATTTG